MSIDCDLPISTHQCEDIGYLAEPRRKKHTLTKLKYFLKKPCYTFTLRRQLGTKSQSPTFSVQLPNSILFLTKPGEVLPQRDITSPERFQFQLMEPLTLQQCPNIGRIFMELITNGRKFKASEDRTTIENRRYFGLKKGHNAAFGHLGDFSRPQSGNQRLPSIGNGFYIRALGPGMIHPNHLSTTTCLVEQLVPRKSIRKQL